MRYTTQISILAGLAVMGGVAGVSLGRSAIAQINPVHFEPVATHFYADRVPYRSASGPADLGGTDYLQADQSYSAAPACIGCDDYAADYAPRRDRPLDVQQDDPTGRETAGTVAETVEIPIVEPPPPNREWILRYMTYEVAAEPEVQAEVVQPEQVAPATAES